MIVKNIYKTRDLLNVYEGTENGIPVKYLSKNDLDFSSIKRRFINGVYGSYDNAGNRVYIYYHYDKEYHQI